ncbi:hypothetical protein VDGL01_00323 [Verticillium dahliae]
MKRGGEETPFFSALLASILLSAVPHLDPEDIAPSLQLILDLRLFAVFFVPITVREAIAPAPRNLAFVMSAEGWTYGTPVGTANDGPMITGIAIAFTTLSLIVICLRMYVRGFLIKATGADDWIICFTWIGCAGFAIVTIIREFIHAEQSCAASVNAPAETKWGLGLLHLDDFPEENVYQFGLLQYMGAPLYVLHHLAFVPPSTRPPLTIDSYITSIYGFKLSLLFSYLRIIPKGVYRYATYIVIALCSMFHLSFLIVQINLCTPTRLQWDTSVAGTCVKAVHFYLSMASLTILFDVVIQRRKKLVLLGLLALGVFTTIIQIFRIQTVVLLANYLDSAPLIMWSTIENNLGVIVTCVPTLAPLVKAFRERSTGASGGPSQKYAAQGTGASSAARGGDFAMRSWRGRGSGIMPLGSGVDHEFGRGRATPAAQSLFSTEQAS